MNAILIKVFATALALSQVTTRPDQIKTHFDPASDQAAVTQILRDGCAQMRKAFDIEDVNLDDLITTAMDDPKAIAGDNKAFRGLDFNDLKISYQQFCKNETVPNSPVDLGAVIEFYNKAMVDLPTDERIKALRPGGGYVVLDGKNQRYTEVFDPDHRRLWVPLTDIPEHVRNAFVTAEDKRFYQHKGVDERGLIRAFLTNLAEPGRPQGGSTITQQVAKNLLVGDDVTYERKMREMVVASRIESLLGKPDILALYLNSIYLGRSSWGVEMAARSYFGKSAKDLNIAEGALLAGLTKGPNYFNPERHPDRAQERLAYVLGRMQADNVISADEAKAAQASLPKLAAFDRQRRDSGFYFVDQIAREARSLGIDAFALGSSTVHATIRPELQKTAETALQDGLARYEANTGRARFKGPEANLADAVKAAEADTRGSGPAWQRALETARLPLYDVHWTPAIVLSNGRSKDGGLRVGLADGRTLPLSAGAAGRRGLQVHDVVFVRVTQGKSVRAELRVRPEVQGAVVVLDNNTGAILALAGGFSYPLSQLNRATQSVRQPGSTLKPFTYLAALRKGLQPNTVVRDMPITLPPISGSGAGPGPTIAYLNGGVQDRDYWTPKNYDSGAVGITTLRRALENSKNLVTANLLDGPIDPDPATSLDKVCALTVEAQVYKECVRYYPFVLGAQPARLVDLAAFYAAVATEGARPSPHVIDSIEQNGRSVYRNTTAPIWLGSADRASFYQLKTMLQGVVARGTAASIHQLSPYVAGKTGTSDNENDAWFIGTTNDVTVGVWVGYDNADGKRRTLGGGMTGAKVAIPIFEPVMQAVWANYAAKTPLAPPSLIARRQLVAVPIELYSGDVLPARTPNAFMEYMRVDRTGQVADTQYSVVSREEAGAMRNYNGDSDGDLYWSSGQPYGYPQGTMYSAQPRQPDPPPFFGLFQPLFQPQQQQQQATPQQRPRRVDPDYFWGRRQYN